MILREGEQLTTTPGPFRECVPQMAVFSGPEIDPEDLALLQRMRVVSPVSGGRKRNFHPLCWHSLVRGILKKTDKSVPDMERNTHVSQ